MKATLAEYKDALQRMDWTFEFSDDNSVYRAGRAELRKLHAMQAEVDPNGSMWLLHIKEFGPFSGIPGPRVGVFV